MDKNFIKLWKFLYYPNLKIPKNIRLFLTTEIDAHYLNKGQVQHESHEMDFKFLVNERGSILNSFTRVEFLMTELIRLMILGYEVEKSEMILDVISAVPINRKITSLKKWKVIDSELAKTLIALFDVRNGFAHKFSIDEITYKNKPMNKYINEGTFEKFRKDLEKSWREMIKSYIKEQNKIDFQEIEAVIRSENKLGQNQKW